MENEGKFCTWCGKDHSTCPECSGRGQWPHGPDHIMFCSMCGGTGRVVSICLEQIKNRKFNIVVRSRFSRFKSWVRGLFRVSKSC